MAAMLLAACLLAFFLIRWSAASGEYDGDRLDDEAGETWIQGRGYSHALKLMDSGHYAMQVQCDVCDEPISKGTWQRQGNAVVLRNASDDIAMTLIPFDARGCNGLVVQGQVEINIPGDIYFREADRCAQAL